MMPVVAVLSAPSGGGKSTITRRVLSERKDSRYAVSATTRTPRAGEENGVAYHFVTGDAFEQQVQAGAFLEHAVYNGNRYGTLADEVRQAQQAGHHVLLDIEVVGARQVRERLPEAVLIFIMPPSGKVLADRLRARGTDDEVEVAGRLEVALSELAAVQEYDYVVVNDDLEDAVRAVHAILDAEARRTNRQRHIPVLLDRIRTEVAAELLRLTATR
jgi:guanylate kinase